MILNKYPLSQSSVDVYNRDTGIIIVHQSEVPIPTPDFKVNYDCRNLIEISDNPSVYKGYMETRHKGQVVSLEKYYRSIERNPRNLERIRKYLPKKPEEGSVRICKDNYCYQLAKTLGFGQVGLVVLLCDLGRSWLKGYSEKEACNSVLKLQPIGRKFFWETAALQSLKGMAPDIKSVWACLPNGEGLIIEDRTFSVKSSSLSSKKIRTEGRDFLSRLHSRRWVHNDIHKGNIQKKRDGSLTFIDYGYARYYPPDKQYSDFSAEAAFIYGPVSWDIAVALDNVHFDICFGEEISRSSRESLRSQRNLYLNRLRRFWRSDYREDIAELNLRLEKLMCGNKHRLVKSVDGLVTTYSFDHESSPIYENIKTNLELLKS